MSTIDRELWDVRCDGRCSLCNGAPSEKQSPEIEGAKLAAWSAVVFFLPIVAMAAGAAVAGHEGVRQMMGAVVGGAVGVAIARAGLRMSQKRGKDRPS